MDYITNETIATIAPIIEDPYKVTGFTLTLYKEKEIIFQKVYSTYTGAQIAFSKLEKKYNLL